VPGYTPRKRWRCGPPVGLYASAFAFVLRRDAPSLPACARRYGPANRLGHAVTIPYAKAKLFQDGFESDIPAK
jgi:hypothetical protein